MYKSTYGILFFGTPHQGSVKKALLKMIPVPDHPRRELLNQISPDSEVLRMQLSDFKNIVGDRKVASFFETELTPEPELVSEEAWGQHFITDNTGTKWQMGSHRTSALAGR
jgi:hypothetical protein